MSGAAQEAEVASWTETTDGPELPPEVSRAFQVDGGLVAARPLHGGHIHDAWAASYRGPRGRIHLVHQRINADVFEDPVGLVENVVRVSRHLRERLLAEGVGEVERRVLTVVPAADGRPYWIDGDGATWRTFLFVPGARSGAPVEGPESARGAARAFGDYQRRLLDLPGPRLRETIPGFHDTPARFRRLREVVEGDPLGRAADAGDAVAAIEARAARIGVLPDAREWRTLPERIVHNDTKLDNVLFDATSGEAICIVDLDTTMSGLAPWDFGDMVRSAVTATAEDDASPAALRFRGEIYEALARGYLEATRSFLTPAEIDALVPAAELITLETAMRFLTDHLEGDRYFRIRRPGQNLDRCRSQLRLLQELERQRELCREIVERSAGEVG